MARMSLPLLPGLQPKPDAEDTDATAPAPLAENPIGAFLDGLGDDVIAQLEQMAAEQAPPADDALGEPPAPDSSDVNDGDPPKPGDENAGDDPAQAPADGTVPAADLDQVASHAEAAVGESSQLLSSMQELDGGDNQADVDKLIKQATTFDAAVQKAAGLVDKAVSKEDAEGAAQAGIDAQEALEVVQHLCEAAKTLVNKTTVGPMQPQDHPALKAWAARVLKKAPTIAM
jgi:hypothetical protein